MKHLTTTRLAALCIVATALVFGFVGCETTPKKGQGHDHGSHQH